MRALDQGAMRYREQCHAQPMSQWSSSRRLIYAALEGMVNAIEQARMHAEQGMGMRGCQGWGVPFIVMDPGVLAVATICAVLDRMKEGRCTIQMAVSGIGHYIEAEYHFMMLKQEFPKLLAYMRRRLKRGWTQRSIRSAREKMGELGENWSLKQRRQIGAKLLELVVVGSSTTCPSLPRHNEPSLMLTLTLRSCVHCSHPWSCRLTSGRPARQVGTGC
jgi:hypothetical protein